MVQRQQHACYQRFCITCKVFTLIQETFVLFGRASSLGLVSSVIQSVTPALSKRNNLITVGCTALKSSSPYDCFFENNASLV